MQQFEAIGFQRGGRRATVLFVPEQGQYVVRWQTPAMPVFAAHYEVDRDAAVAYAKRRVGELGLFARG